MSEDQFKPEVGSWWTERNALFNSSRFEVLMVGKSTAYCRRSNESELLVALQRWESRFTQFLPLPKPRTCYAIQWSDGTLAGTYKEPPTKLNDGDRILRVTTTYELFEDES